MLEEEITQVPANNIAHRKHTHISELATNISEQEHSTNSVSSKEKILPITKKIVGAKCQTEKGELLVFNGGLNKIYHL